MLDFSNGFWNGYVQDTLGNKPVIQKYPESKRDRRKEEGRRNLISRRRQEEKTISRGRQEENTRRERGRELYGKWAVIRKHVLVPVFVIIGYTN